MKSWLCWVLRLISSSSGVRCPLNVHLEVSANGPTHKQFIHTSSFNIQCLCRLNLNLFLIFWYGMYSFYFVIMQPCLLRDHVTTLTVWSCNTGWQGSSAIECLPKSHKACCSSLCHSKMLRSWAIQLTFSYHPSLTSNSCYSSWRHANAQQKQHQLFILLYYVIIFSVSSWMNCSPK